jgi:hypothetical protein
MSTENESGTRAVPSCAIEKLGHAHIIFYHEFPPHLPDGEDDFRELVQMLMGTFRGARRLQSRGQAKCTGQHHEYCRYRIEDAWGTSANQIGEELPRVCSTCCRDGDENCITVSEDCQLHPLVGSDDYLEDAS